jgi:hypothetical protein
MDSDRTPLGKGKDVLHRAVRAAPLEHSVEQPCTDPQVEPLPAASFVPPPWLEFTTSEPSVSATRVKPPGTMQLRTVEH